LSIRRRHTRYSRDRSSDVCSTDLLDAESSSLHSKQLSLLPPSLTNDEQRVYELLQEKEQVNIDDIALHCAWPQSKLAIVLLEMEMKGVLLALPGKVFKLV